MKKINYTFFILGIFLMTCQAPLSAQDIHFSQFWNTPLEVSPSLAGIAKEDTRVFGSYKSQWASVPVNYTTFAGAFDTKWTPFKIQNGFFGLGLIFNHDQAGDSDWTLANLQGLISYTKQISKGVFGSIGTQLGIGQRSFKFQDLTFDNQFNGEFFDPSLPTKENFSSTNSLFFDSHVGLNIRVQHPNQRTKVDFGVGIHHLNTPSQNFLAGAEIELPVRNDFYVLGALKITERLDLMVNILYRSQMEFQELVLGPAIRIYLNTNRTKELALEGGVNLRTGDSAIPYFGMLFRQWRVGLIYDINTSDFRNATGFNGGPEFTLIYTITKPQSKNQKLCPLF